MVYLETVPRKEHVPLDCYVKPMELVQCHAQLMEDQEMELHKVLVALGKCVNLMEHVQHHQEVNIDTHSTTF